jgi:peptidyl-prolyl cis-trans isomerase C
MFLGIFFLDSWVLAACSGFKGTGTSSPQSSSDGTSQTVETLATFTPEIPSPTPEPQAVSVNGEGISLAEYQAALAQYQAALVITGTNPPDENTQRQTVLDDFINQILLSQAAYLSGFSVSEEDLQVRIDTLATQTSNSGGLLTWESENGYSDASFKQALIRSLAAAWERDQIAAEVPESADQVHARQILVTSETEAQSILSSLNSGTDFATLAYYYENETSGDLGWFPKGYLIDLQVEEAAFALIPGEYSGIIHSNAGYQIIQVIERDPNHILSTDARLALQNIKLNEWIQDQRSQAEIIVYLP